MDSTEGVVSNGYKPEGEVNDQIAQALSMLESSSADSRIYGINTLDEIAKVAKDEQRRILEILTSYVREKAPWHIWKSYLQTNKESLKPPSDVQIVLSMIGHHKRTWSNDEENPIDLNNTDLRGADLRGVHFEWANLAESHLENASMEEANLFGAFLHKINAKSVNMARAQLKYALLENANLQEADLRKANLQQSRLIGANLRKANLGIYIGEDGGIHGSADLEEADLESANLKEANLKGANFRGANLWGAKLNRADLEMTIFHDANLAHADLREARHLTVYQLENARSLFQAKMDPQLLVEVTMKAPHLTIPLNISELLNRDV